MLKHVNHSSFTTFKKRVLLPLALVLGSSIFHVAMAGGDSVRGEALVKQKNCASCHGQDFWQTMSPDYPRLAGQHPDYLYQALLSYQAKNPNFGRGNAIMGGQAATLSRQDMRDIAEYLHQLPSQFILQK